MESFILCRKYRVLNVLGNSSDTIIYFAQHVMLREFYIIKKINKEDPNFLLRLKEVQFLMTLKHPCIPRLYDVFETGKEVYFVEEYMEGTTLQQVCDSEQLSEQTIISYGISLCNLIYYLHSADPPVLHLDIKPSNLIVHNGKLALIDFSAAQFATRDAVTHFGTRFFAAPEQYESSQVSEQTDIYAAGAVLYYMVTHAGSQNKEPGQQKSCNPKLWDIILQCLNQDRNKRYDSILKVGDLLSGLRIKEPLARKELCCYAVAGTQNRIGTTQFALQLASYLTRNKKRCVYSERNQSHAARELIRNEGILNREKGLYECHKVIILPYSQNPFLTREVLRDCDAAVFDYGVLTEDIVSEFTQADQSFLLYGGKPWEKKLSESLCLFQGDLRNMCFLGNFQTAVNFEKNIPREIRNKYARLPYEPDLWDFTDKSLVWRLLDEKVR